MDLSMFDEKKSGKYLFAGFPMEGNIYLLSNIGLSREKKGHFLPGPTNNPSKDFNLRLIILLKYADEKLSKKT